MNYQTELMRSILTNPKAQEIIDWVSSIYGDSYVGLWLFQATGIVLEQVENMMISLRDETNVANATLLLDMYEQMYGLAKNPSLTIEQRRYRLINKTRARGPCNPKRLAEAVSVALDGVPVEITERVAKNTFLVNIRESVEDITPAVAVLERMKPAHLIYQIRVALQIVSDADIKTAIAVTQSEQYKVEVRQ